METDRIAFGLTLEQVDTLDRLVRTISAHGDVIALGHAGELDGRTLPTLGQGIYEAAKAVRGILDRVETQRLEVREQRAEYRAGSAAHCGAPPPAVRH